MKNSRNIWIFGLIVTLAIIIIPLVIFMPRDAQASSADPWANVPKKGSHTDHHPLMSGPYETPSDVTQACLECHAEAADQVMHTTHWTWESEPVNVPGHDQPATIGKKTQLNNFCISVIGNWPKCTTCHIGYGWEDASFDFSNQNNIDCLACHADMNIYSKGYAGNPVDGVDLAAAAQSVRNPTRENCGKCHFDGGGGNGVKHGDLDESLTYPDGTLDVHMGSNDFQCTDCHWTKDHQVMGSSLSYDLEKGDALQCTNCHEGSFHGDERINAHLDTVACQTCHVPAMALKDPTKTDWDWSTAGQDLDEDHYTYLKIKGSFIYQKDYQPSYMWFDGSEATRYLLGDKIDPTGVTVINPPSGSIHDPDSRIFPFKVHKATQPYDAQQNILLVPKTVGEGGFWTDFDWDQALELGGEISGLGYSGEYGFADTLMYWPTTHMVQPKENALQCQDCHGENGRLDWQALGYPGDPMEWGSRFQEKLSLNK